MSTEAPRPTPDQELRLAMDESPDGAWADCVWETLRIHCPELDEDAIVDLWITGDRAKRAQAVSLLIEGTAGTFAITLPTAQKICCRTWGS